MALTTKMRAFVEAYCGNATEAALKAGYSPRTAAFIGAENLKKPQIKEAIAEREKISSESRIADRQERQSFWTSVMRDPEEDMRNRLKAAELLGKSECDFAERVEVSGEMDIGVLFDPEKRRRVLERIKG